MTSSPTPTTATTEAADRDRIEREVLVEAPPERVWALVTEAEHLGTWFADSGAEIDLRPGGAIELRWRDYGTSRGRIERVEPERLLAFRWAPFKEPGGVEPEPGNSTLVEMSLSPEAGGARTRVRVVESGFAALECSPERRAQNLAGNTEGWEQELGELAAHALATAG